MKCPACDHTLTETQVGALKVDVCHDGCGGIWFDAFELQRVDEAHEVGGEHLVSIKQDPSRNVDRSRKRACPRCAGIKLKRHLFGPKSKVEVDHCPNCGGYWLDAGELETIRQEQKPASHAKPAGTAQIDSEIIRYLYRVQIEIRPSRPSAG